MDLAQQAAKSATQAGHLDVRGSLKYSPLSSKRSIRLIAFANDSNDSLVSEFPVTTTLHTFELESAPPFNALSYTWGEPYHNSQDDSFESAPEFVRIILCNGQFIKITQNLFDALAIFKLQKLTNYLWIDAICIDQENLDERSEQVLLMGDIYSLATCVLVWLGPHKAGIENFLWATTELLDKIQSYDNPTVPNDIFSAADIVAPPEHWQKFSMEDPRPRLIELQEFYLSCRWFSRMWVFQEVALAQHVRIFCGNTELSFQRSIQLALVLQRLGWLQGVTTIAILEHKRKPKREWFKELTVVGYIISNGELKWMAQGEWKQDTGVLPVLHAVLTLCRFYYCSDNRDKVYSLLGFVIKKFPWLKIPEWLHPNYSIETKELYTTVMSNLLHNSTSLNIIGDTRRSIQGHKFIDLPSWVIDFSSPRQTITHDHMCDPFNASGCKETETPKFFIDGDELNCFGASFDNVTGILEQPLEDSLTLQLYNVKSLINFIKFYLELPLIILGRPRMTVLEITLRSGQVFISQQNVPTSLEKAAKGAILAYLSWILIHVFQPGEWQESCIKIILEFEKSQLEEDQEILAYLRSKKLLNKVNGKLEQVLPRAEVINECYAIDKLASPYSDLISRLIHRKTLFSTGKGLLGIGLETVKKGDQVWMICNASSPMILRSTPKPDELTIVGECYLHNLMHGELLQEKWDTKENIRPIRIV